MSSLTVRNLDESIKAGLRLRAARHGWSMEQEVRHILQQTLAEGAANNLGFAELVRRRFEGLDAEGLTTPVRQTLRKPPEFGAS